MKNETTVKNPLRILHLEDSSLDAEIIREPLIDAGFSFQLDLARDERGFTAFLKSGGYDLILADYHLPAFEGEEALRLSKLHCPDVPFICVSGAIGEVKAVGLLKRGATDYVAKTMLDKLAMAMVRAVDETRERSERRLAAETLQKKIDELQRFQDLTVDRELAMIELKKEVNELLKQAGREEKYRIVG